MPCKIFFLYKSPSSLGIRHIITCLYIICFNLYTVDVTLGPVQDESYNRMHLICETGKGCNDIWIHLNRYKQF